MDTSLTSSEILPDVPDLNLVSGALPYRHCRHLVLARHRACLSQGQLAERLGVTRQALAQWEASDGAVTLATATRWAAAVGLGALPAVDFEVPSLVDSAGAPLPLSVLRHGVLVVGAERAAVMRSLAADLEGLPVRTVGVAFGEALTTKDLANLPERLRSGGCAPFVLVADLESAGPEVLNVAEKVTRYARATGLYVILGGHSLGSLDRWVPAQVGSVLSADEPGSVTTVRMVWRG